NHSVHVKPRFVTPTPHTNDGTKTQRQTAPARTQINSAQRTACQISVMESSLSMTPAEAVAAVSQRIVQSQRLFLDFIIVQNSRAQTRFRQDSPAKVGLAREYVECRAAEFAERQDGKRRDIRLDLDSIIDVVVA